MQGQAAAEKSLGVAFFVFVLVLVLVLESTFLPYLRMILNLVRAISGGETAFVVTHQIFEDEDDLRRHTLTLTRMGSRGTEHWEGSRPRPAAAGLFPKPRAFSDHAGKNTPLASNVFAAREDARPPCEGPAPRRFITLTRIGSLMDPAATGPFYRGNLGARPYPQLLTHP